MVIKLNEFWRIVYNSRVNNQRQIAKLIDNDLDISVFRLTWARIDEITELIT